MIHGCLQTCTSLLPSLLNLDSRQNTSLQKSGMMIKSIFLPKSNRNNRLIKGCKHVLNKISVLTLLVLATPCTLYDNNKARTDPHISFTCTNLFVTRGEYCCAGSLHLSTSMESNHNTRNIILAILLDCVIHQLLRRCFWIFHLSYQVDGSLVVYHLP